MPTTETAPLEGEHVHSNEGLLCNRCGESRRFGSSLCDDCEAQQPCDRCGQFGELSHSDSYGGSLCESCDERYYCSDCGSDFTYEEDAEDCCRPQYYCPRCDSSFYDEYDADNCCDGDSSYNGVVPTLEPVQPYPITVPVIEGRRPARLCSLEQELASGAAVVAAMLSEHHLSPYDHVLGYHSSGDGAGSVHVEEDGSLPGGGGEVVYDRFDLSFDGLHSRRLSEALTKIRQLRDHKLVKTSFAAGIHVHVAVKAQDGSCLSPRDTAALYELWCYAEDMLYSLSAAGWNRHRQPQDSYHGYCKAVPKVEGSATPTKVWRAMRSDRYYGLNFQKLYNAVSNCTCGAATMGDWPSCDCGSMERATIEWRVFNASTLPRTVHAWMVMAQAMTAYAREHELGTLVPNPYGSQDEIDKRQVLEYLLEKLPLTDGERGLIRDAADRSPGL